MASVDEELNHVDLLVAGCNKALWRQRMVTTSGWWLVAPAALSGLLALVHRGATSLAVGWTLPPVLILVIAIVVWRVVEDLKTKNNWVPTNWAHRSMFVKLAKSLLR